MPEGVVEGGRGGKGLIVTALQNKEIQITVAPPPPTTTPTTTNLTVEVSVTGRELAYCIFN